MDIIELIKVIIIGIVEGITEWLPISSTGHMLLVDEFIHMNVTPEFREMFLYVIQLGAILAVIILFWNKMWPFQSKKKNGSVIKKETFILWFKVVIACIPGFVAYLLLDFVDNCYVVAAALIVYGVLFIVIENWNRGREPRVKTLEEISYKDAFIIGLFQALSIIPGTSRSGSTIIGGLVIGVSRVTAAEFTFFLAVPVMVGVSLLKIIAFGFSFTSAELITLIVGCVVAFLVSVVVIKFLMSYIKRKDFKVFGWYQDRSRCGRHRILSAEISAQKYPPLVPMRNRRRVYQNYPIKSTERSFTFVPVAPVRIRPPQASSAWYESLLCSVRKMLMPFSSSSCFVLPSTYPPAASVGPSVPSEPTEKTHTFGMPAMFSAAARASS